MPQHLMPPLPKNEESSFCNYVIITYHNLKILTVFDIFVLYKDEGTKFEVEVLKKRWHLDKEA